MQFAPCVVWSRNIQSKTIKRWPTLLLCMQFWHFWWGPSVQDSKQCGLANCDECENWIQTSSHSSTRIRFSWWLLVSDDVADFMCAWRSRGWYCDGKAWCRCIVFRSEEFDASYQDWRPTSWTGWGALDVTDCKALDNQEVIGIETCQRKTTCADTEGECTPHWSWVDWRWAPKTEGTGGGTHFNGGFGSMEASSMAAWMFFVSVGRQGGTQRHFWTMAWSMATSYFGGIFDFPMTESDLSADTCQRPCRVSHNWQRRWVKRGTPSGWRDTWKCSPQCTCCSKSGAIVSSSWPSSSFEVVVNKVFCGSCGHIPPVSRDGQWWTDRNGAHFPGFIQFLCICNGTQSGQYRPKSYCSKPCGNNSKVVGIQWAVAGICTSCSVRAKQSTTHMVIEYRSWWLW